MRAYPRLGIFLMNSALLKPFLVFGDVLSHNYRNNKKNETIPLSLTMPVPENEENGECNGLLWQDLSVVTSHSGEYLLHSSSGFVANGDVCGVLGPSGSGKTTFLSTIAGRPESSLHVFGEVLHYTTKDEGGTRSKKETRFKCAPVRPGSVAWLRQHDAFFEHLTVKETLDLATFLELPHLTPKERNEVATSCLESLGLSDLLPRRIGSSKAVKASGGASLSGGELRRLSVAVELVTMPQLFIADEPTSGIDSKMAENVMSTICEMAKQRKIPCFCTMHQPRSSIWHMLDSIILMAPGGKACYIGSRKEALDYFSKLGHVCPKETNPAEFLIDLVSIDPEDQVQALKDQDRINKLAYAFSMHNSELSRQWNADQECALTGTIHAVDSTEMAARRHPFRVIRRFGSLFRRSLRQNIRSTTLNVFRLMLSTGTALLLSQIFPSIAKGEKPKPKSVVDRVALLSFGVINMCMTAVMKTMDVFAKEKPVVQRERRRNLYTNLEYLLSKALAEVPLDALFAVFFTTTLKATTGLAISWQDITSTFSLMTVAGASLGFFIGSITPSQEAATTTGIPILVIMMIVGVINPSGVDPTAKKPVFIKWIENVSPIASAIKSLALAEFTGMEFEKTKSWFKRFRETARLGGVALVKNGDEVLDALGLKDVTYSQVMQHMFVLSLVNFGLCWIALHISDKHLGGRLIKNFRSNFVVAERGRRGGEDSLSHDKITTEKTSQINSRESRKPSRAPFRAKL